MLPVSDFVSSDESTPESGLPDGDLSDAAAAADAAADPWPAIVVVTLLLTLELLQLLLPDEICGRTADDPFNRLVSTPFPLN